MLISNDLKKLVWDKGKIEQNFNPDFRRKDVGTAWIKLEEFNQETLYGWTIAYINPYKKEGKDDIDNLIPLHWENSKAKGNEIHGWMAAVSSIADYNVYVKKYVDEIHF